MTIPRRSMLILVAAALLLPLAACEDKLTQENFDKIKVGMQVWEVEHILGGKGELESTGMNGSISAGGIMTTEAAPPNQYRWTRGPKSITVIANDGKVVSKAKEGW
jgi:hypothetical protein